MLANNKSNLFAGNPLNRLHVLRSEEQQVNNIENADALYVPFYQFKPLATKQVNKQNRAVLWKDKKSIEKLLPNGSDVHGNIVLLGERNSKYYFAFDSDHPDMQKIEADQEYINLNFQGGQLDREEASILAQARSLLEWNTNHRFCGKCGSSTVSQGGGTKRTCINETCKRTQYPRTDPVVIMCIIHPTEEKILLGRQTKWPKSMYSCLAGFIDSGETIEEAVRRESNEEAGVDIKTEDVFYYSSQPWPSMGGQIMIGCHAFLKGDDTIKISDAELEEAKWFTKDQITKAIQGAGQWDLNIEAELRIPPNSAIAHMLIKSWAEGEIKVREN
jgi:NAD+ diphosphatase